MAGSEGSEGSEGAGGDTTSPTISLPSTWGSGASPFLLALEHATWTELVTCLRLSRSLAAAEDARAARNGEPPAARASAADTAPLVTPLVLGTREPDPDGSCVEPGLGLPEQLLLLMPPPPRYGWPTGMPDAPSAAQWLQRWGYPPVRRAQRLSYLVGAALPSLLASAALPPSVPLPSVPASLDRQALLQATSVRERLQKAVVFLCHRRQSLAALAALRAASDLDGAQEA